MISMFLVLMLTQSTVTANSCNSPVGTWFQKANFKFRGKAFMTFSFICRSVCYEACMTFGDCSSVNYFPGNKTCELNNGTHLEFPENLTASDGSEYGYTFSKGWLFVKLTTAPVCFSTKDNKPGTFNVTIPGQISSFKLVHVSGVVQEDIWGASGKWGTTNGFSTLLTDKNKKIISPPVSMLDQFYRYQLPGRSAANDPELILPAIEPPLTVTSAQALYVWHNEDFKDESEFDNGGTSCAHVYANYTEIII